MTNVSIDGKELTNIQSVVVGFKRDNNNRGEFIGRQALMHITIRRDCSVKKDAQIELFEAAMRNPKKIKLEIKMPNTAGGNALTLKFENAFVAKWDLGSVTDEASSEVIEIYASQTKLTAGKSNASYKVPLTIPNR